MSSSGRGLCFPLVKACVFGSEPKASDEVPLTPRADATADTTPSWQILKLVFCASGLQVSRQAPLLLPDWVQIARNLIKPKLSCPHQRFVDLGMVYVLAGAGLGRTLKALKCFLPLTFSSFRTCTEISPYTYVMMSSVSFLYFFFCALFLLSVYIISLTKSGGIPGMVVAKLGS